MKLIYDLINRRLDQMKDMQLNNQDYKGIWHFYQVYKICLNISGQVDKNIKFKDRLIIKLLQNPNDIKILNNLKALMSEDSFVVESVLTNLKEKEELNEIFEDFYPVNIFGVNLYDRGI